MEKNNKHIYIGSMYVAKLYGKWTTLNSSCVEKDIFFPWEHSDVKISGPQKPISNDKIATMGSIPADTSRLLLASLHNLHHGPYHREQFYILNRVPYFPWYCLCYKEPAVQYTEWVSREQPSSAKQMIYSWIILRLGSNIYNLINLC